MPCLPLSELATFCQAQQASGQAWVCVIGSGLAGITTALRLCEQGQTVLLLTKGHLGESNSQWAQGGIAFAPHTTVASAIPVPFHPHDNLNQHIEDTLHAGANHNRPNVVQQLLAQSPQALAQLLAWGVTFDSTATGEALALTQEGAHRYPRILHAGGDQTGAKVMATLVERLQQQPRCVYIPHTEVVHIAPPTEATSGFTLQLLEAASPTSSESPSATTTLYSLSGVTNVVCATGGLGGLYPLTTNTPLATGDALAFAQQVGVPLADVAFMQFHPTAFVHEGKVRFLVSEAMRGEGGILKNVHGEAFAKRYHPLGELAPRDIVARMIHTEITQQQQANPSAPPHVWLDMSHRSRAWLEHRFPSIMAFASRYGCTPPTDALPVAPAAHYHMGGVHTQPNGATSLAGFYVVGEAACTGLHGANRLASNSLLECVIMGLACADTLVAQASTPPPCLSVAFTQQSIAVQPVIALPPVDDLKQTLHTAANMIRRREVLAHALHQLTVERQSIEDSHQEYPSVQTLRWLKQSTGVLALLQAAVQEPASLGAHFLES